MMDQLKTFGASLGLFLVCDFIWLGFVVKDFNLRQLAGIARLADGDFDLWKIPTAIAYLLMALSVTLFSAPRALEASNPLMAFAWGAALGLIVFGIFDATNLAILKDYPVLFCFTDVAWGTFLYGLVTWVVSTYVASAKSI